MMISSMEPMMPAESRRASLIDLSTELIAKASALSTSINPTTAESIGDLIRNMNCYYSNLIEGHDTSPRDIDRALANDFSKDSKKRELQLEAKAHIEVQRVIDNSQRPFETSAQYIKWIHKNFCERMPKELLVSINSDSGKTLTIIPGEFRTTMVQVGRHIAPEPEIINELLERFDTIYNPKKLNKIDRIIATAASHHRLLWIHPFLDGNGRIARLFSHAYLRQIGIGSSLWSISRGLSRNVEAYRAHLMEADIERQGDLDGRGALTAKGLENFCEFFLKTCLDQINFMSDLIRPNELLNRIELFIREEREAGRLPKGAFGLMREAFYSGTIERGKAPAITGYKERQARTVLNSLVNAKLLISDTSKGPVRLNFPVEVVERWLPRLYPVT